MKHVNRFMNIELVELELKKVQSERKQLKSKSSTLRVQAWRLKKLIQALHQTEMPI